MKLLKHDSGLSLDLDLLEKTYINPRHVLLFRESNDPARQRGLLRAPTQGPRTPLRRGYAENARGVAAATARNIQVYLVHILLDENTGGVAVARARNILVYLVNILLDENTGGVAFARARNIQVYLVNILLDENTGGVAVARARNHQV